MIPESLKPFFTGDDDFNAFTEYVRAYLTINKNSSRGDLGKALDAVDAFRNNIAGLKVIESGNSARLSLVKWVKTSYIGRHSIFLLNGERRYDESEVIAAFDNVERLQAICAGLEIDKAALKERIHYLENK